MPAKDTETRRWNKDVQRLHSQHDFVVKNFPKRPYLREFQNNWRNIICFLNPFSHFQQVSEDGGEFRHTLPERLLQRTPFPSDHQTIYVADW